MKSLFDVLLVGKTNETSATKKKTATIIVLTVTVEWCSWCSSSIPCRAARKLCRAEIP